MPLAEWTVMVFLNGDNNLEEYAVLDYLDMAKVGSTPEVNIIVQFDRSGRYHATSPHWSGCYRFRVERHVPPAPRVAVQSLGDVDMGSGQVLREFVDWAATAYPAKRYMLQMWGHGQGWRFFDAMTPDLQGPELTEFREFRRSEVDMDMRRLAAALADSPRAPRPRMTAGIPIDLVLPGTTQRILRDETSNSVLFNREMQDSLAGRHFDVIGFDVCLMAMIETAYAMRSLGDVMVASEELEPPEGWNEARWMALLTTAPDMTATDLGRALVRTYRDTFTGVDESVTLSAIALGRVETIANRIDAFSDALSAVDDGAFGQVLAARASCRSFAPSYGRNGVDLAHFARQARGFVDSPAVRATADALVDAVTDAIIDQHVGRYRLDDFGSTGLAVYFPKTRAVFDADQDSEGYVKSNTVYPVEFVQTRRWADFLVERYLPNT